MWDLFLYGTKAKLANPLISVFGGHNTALPVRVLMPLSRPSFLTASFGYWRQVVRGEIQCRGLGMAVESWSEDGKPVPVGTPGELVCARPFPVMPVSFWKDEGGKKYHASYFERFPGVWHHGDYVACVFSLRYSFGDQSALTESLYVSKGYA
jgi:acyl-coenzyme A synthetase/AMP-(fatty) acid ligase